MDCFSSQVAISSVLRDAHGQEGQKRAEGEHTSTALLDCSEVFLCAIILCTFDCYVRIDIQFLSSSDTGGCQPAGREYGHGMVQQRNAHGHHQGLGLHCENGIVLQVIRSRYLYCST